MHSCKITTRFVSRIIAITLLLTFSPGSLSRAAQPSDPDPQISSTNIQQSFHAPLMSGCGGEIVPVINDAFEQEVVTLVNQERTSRGIPPLKRTSSLDEAARYHSTDLGLDDYFAHDSYDRAGGDLVFVCSTWSRIGSYYDGARGENIAAGYGTPAAVVSAWMNSDGHRFNILNNGSWEIGVGYFEGAGGYYTYWTQDFGRQDGVYPLIINNDNSETNDPMVSLYIYGTWGEMRLRNNMDEWTSWQPFENSVTWQLPLRNGDHVVSVELRDGEKTAASQDTIALTGFEAQPQLCNLTEAITFTYDIATQTLYPTNVRLTPENVGSSEPLDWNVDVQGDWFAVSPTSGSSPQSITVSPLDTFLQLEIIHQGTVTLTVTTPSDTAGSPHVINVSMNVISGTLRSIFIPFLINPPP